MEAEVNLNPILNRNCQIKTAIRISTILFEEKVVGGSPLRLDKTKEKLS